MQTGTAAHPRARTLRTVIGYALLATPPLFAAFRILLRCLHVVDRSVNRITCAHTAENAAILSACPSLHRYAATPYLLGPHMNTLFAAFFRTSPGISYHRVLLPTGDGGRVAVDWASLPRRGQPLLLLLHGLTGGSQERYIQWAVRSASTRTGAACVVMNARGCGESGLSTPRGFSAAWTHDLAACVAYLRAVAGEGTPIFAVGFSLGAGILSKYLCEAGERAGITAAVMACASMDMRASTALLETWAMRYTYNAMLAGSLRRFAERHVHVFQAADWFDARRMRAARTIREFDAATIVPMFGYDSVWDYYADASTASRVAGIRVPALYLNAVDDPICATVGIPHDAMSQNPHTIVVETQEGGHVAWCQGWLPTGSSWDNDALCEYMAAHMRGRVPWVSAGEQDAPLPVEVDASGALRLHDGVTAGAGGATGEDSPHLLEA